MTRFTDVSADIAGPIVSALCEHKVGHCVGPVPQCDTSIFVWILLASQTGVLLSHGEPTSPPIIQRDCVGLELI